MSELMDNLREQNQQLRVGSTGCRITLEQLLAVVRDRKQTISFSYDKGMRAIGVLIHSENRRRQREVYVSVPDLERGSRDFLAYAVDQTSQMVANMVQTDEDMARG